MKTVVENEKTLTAILSAFVSYKNTSNVNLVCLVLYVQDSIGVTGS